MGFFKNLKARMKAVDNLTESINNGDLVVDRKNLTIKKNDNDDQKK